MNGGFFWRRCLISMSSLFTAPPVAIKATEEKEVKDVEGEEKACNETVVKDDSIPPPATAEPSESVVECKEEEKITPRLHRNRRPSCRNW
ncbi:hypothetical protein L6452_39077 [Arctium lappa]|uniref:Uncharacterized protein n=1 Tax=Arctium lappa TaxID=4217 RepID=A0ACB8XRR4_ARCLA|nr:hypothetical protein L6452_39077 [Arctium lappa]